MCTGRACTLGVEKEHQEDSEKPANNENRKELGYNCKNSSEKQLSAGLQTPYIGQVTSPGEGDITHISARHVEAKHPAHDKGWRIA